MPAAAAWGTGEAEGHLGAVDGRQAEHGGAAPTPTPAPTPAAAPGLPSPPRGAELRDIVRR